MKLYQTCSLEIKPKSEQQSAFDNDTLKYKLGRVKLTVFNDLGVFFKKKRKKKKIILI